jgi:O-Antigen ligase
MKRIGPLGWRGATDDQPAVRLQSREEIGPLPSRAAFSATAKHERDTLSLASGTAGVSPAGTFQPRAIAWAGLILLLAVAAGLFGQGAYYPSVQRYVGVLVAAATVLALAAWPPTRSDAGLLPVVPALALAAWAGIDAALRGAPAASAGVALLLLSVVAVLLVCRRLGQEDREVLFIGVTGIGLVVALAGWLGVAGHAGSLALQAQGVWRASSMLSYPNATAAVLVPIALVVLARLVESPRSLPLVLAVTGLLAGLAATASRAGAFALAVGLLVLAGLRGPRATARAAVGPCAGAVLALVCLLPSMPVASSPRLVLALFGLCAGLALAAMVARLRWRLAVALLLVGAVVGVLALVVMGGRGASDAVGTVAEVRINLASPDRGAALRAAVRVAAEQPLTGAGPGQVDLRWRGADGGIQLFAYAHNEYAQVAAELGLVGLALLVVLLAAIARLLWSARATAPSKAAWAGVVAATAAFAVHSTFDFVWHLPAVVLTVMLLVGAVLPAPHGAGARKRSVTVQGREVDENQAAS